VIDLKAIGDRIIIYIGDFMNVVVPLAEGFEEIEAISIIDVLRRAEIKVSIATLQGNVVESRRKVKVLADIKIDQVSQKDFDGIVLPGGNPGYINLGRSQKVIKLIQDFNSAGKLVAAICAAPSVLAKAGVLANRRATIFPGMERELPKPRNESVVVDGNIITSQGPATAMEFSLKIVESLSGSQKAREIAEQLLYRK
jgi:4-methyl-5(b-hydroxyethyl)-thiazole monophosphate biosynthesis